MSRRCWAARNRTKYNLCESWNNGLHQIVGHYHPSVWSLTPRQRRRGNWHSTEPARSPPKETRKALDHDRELNKLTNILCVELLRIFYWKCGLLSYPCGLMSSWAFVLGDSVLGDFVLGAFVLHSKFAALGSGPLDKSPVTTTTTTTTTTTNSVCRKWRKLKRLKIGYQRVSTLPMRVSRRRDGDRTHKLVTIYRPFVSHSKNRPYTDVDPSRCLAQSHKHWHRPSCWTDFIDSLAKSTFEALPFPV